MDDSSTKTGKWLLNAKINEVADSSIMPARKFSFQFVLFVSLK